MADLKYYDIILKPIMTEAAMSMFEKKKYSFYVHVDANKTQVKEAVEKLFNGVKVARVNIMNLNGKKKRRGRIIGKTSKKKKAIVFLSESSEEIKLFENA